MASLSIVSTSTSRSNSVKSSSHTKMDIVKINEPFPMAIKTCKGFEYILDAPLSYDIYLECSGLHWFLLVHCCGKGTSFPYISLEITTDTSTHLIPTMRIIQASNIDREAHSAHACLGDAEKTAASQLGKLMTTLKRGGVGAVVITFGRIKPTKIGTKHNTIMELCEKAEHVRLGMRNYKLFMNNCQHFCNNVLQELGLPPQPTNVGPRNTKFQKIEEFVVIGMVDQEDTDNSDQEQIDSLDFIFNVIQEDGPD